MDIDFKISADYTDVNRVMSGLMAAMRPRPIHSLAARTALKQVKSKYAQRFASQVNTSSLWQQTKQQVGGFLPLGSDPGFLTGTTFKSLVAEASFVGGWVYPKGPWPQGSGSAKSVSATAASSDEWTGFEWDEKGVYAQPIGCRPLTFFSWPSMLRIEYGAFARKGGIEWLFLDVQDVDVIMANLEAYFTCVIERNYAGLKAVFDRTRYSGRSSEEAQEAPVDEAVVAEIISASTDPRVQRIEQHMKMPIAEVFRAYAVNSVEDLILRLESIKETSQDVLETDWGKKDKK